MAIFSLDDLAPVPPPITVLAIGAADHPASRPRALVKNGPSERWCRAALSFERPAMAVR
jgi:hypothetical protein